jgi:cytochrome c peroxidase
MRLLTVATIAGLAMGSASAAPDASGLRDRAKEFFEPLPAQMPGSENDTAALVKLGRKLYFDKRLSADRTISCNTCHPLDKGGAYDQSTSPGVSGKHGERNSPTVLNAGFHIAQFWDGRSPNLETQAKEPMLNPNEMAMPAEAELLKRLRDANSYRDGFAQAFPDSPEPTTIENMAKAIAAFERTLITHDRFDDFLNGKDRAMSRAELKGLDLFLDAGCQKCHSGLGLGGNSFQKMGLMHPDANTNDLGRAKITGNDADRYKFKVPSLRNVALTPPYFHDGKVGTLPEAVRLMGRLQLDRELSAAEVESITAFLRSLSDKGRAR